MKISLFLILFIFSAQAEILTSELKKPFLADGSPEGPLSIEKVELLEEGLNQLGHQDIINRFKEKLGVHTVDGVRLYIQACHTPPETYGRYLRGGRVTYTRTIMPEDDPQSIELFWKPQETMLEKINDTYRVTANNNPAYASLILQSWPTLCIRPGISFADALITFAHEAEHFIGDDYKIIDYSDLEVDKYIQDELLSSGGEYHAFQAGAKVAMSLHQMGHQNRYHDYLAFFDSNGELLRPEKLKSYILDYLEYRNKYKEKFYEIIKGNHQQALKDYKLLSRYLDHYNTNLAIFVNNFDIYISNRKIYQNNIRIYQENISKLEESMNSEAALYEISHFQELMAQENKLLETLKIEQTKNTEAISFFNEMVFQTEAQLYKLDLEVKLE